MNLYYLGNKKLKAAGVKLRFLPKQISEIQKCVEDPVYFAKKYIKIVDVDKGLIDFDMYDYQKTMVHNFVDKRFNICLLPRRAGKSMSYCAFVLWCVLFRPYYSVAIFAHKAVPARKMLAHIKLAYEQLPMWLQQGIVEWNKGSIELENGSTIIADSTTGNSGRSGGFSLVILDEFAFIPKNIAEDFMKSVYPTITSGTNTKIIIVSTAHGMNHFYKLWNDALNGHNAYTPFQVHWSQIPGRDEKWKEQTIKNTSLQDFQQEFENDFFGTSTDTLVDLQILKTFVYVPPIIKQASLDIYKIPEQTHQYIVTVDTSRGTKEDYSASVVIDVTANPMRLVAKYRNNEIEPKDYANVVYEMAKKYNDAYVLVEINDIGGQIADLLWHDCEYENVIKTTNDRRLFNEQKLIFIKKSAKYGIRTTRKVKNKGLASVKSLLENKKLIVEDYDTIEEMSNFVKTGDTYKASPGFHDDLAMCLVLFGWLYTQKNYKELLDTRVVSEEKIEQFNLIPFIGPEGTEQARYVQDGDLWLVSDEDYFHRTIE